MRYVLIMLHNESYQVVLRRFETTLKVTTQPKPGDAGSRISNTLSSFSPNYIGERDFIDGRVVYDECLRFQCDDVIILESRALNESDD